MANAGASIEAVLTLNASGFNEGIKTSTNALNKFIEATNKLKGTSVSQGIQQLEKSFVQLDSAIQRVDTINKQSLNTFSKLSNAINKMANRLKILQSEEINVVEAVNTMNSIFKAFSGSLNGATVQVQGYVNSQREVATATRTSVEAQRQAVASLNSNRDAVMGLITGNNQLSNSEKNVASSTNQATSSVQKQASVNRSASASTNQLTSATNGLSRALSSLKMVGTLVASMMVWNFASSLVTATRETVNAKSEMEGYFQMLHFSQGEIDSFNQALDETVKQFQRVNKYSLGETISSIGVEFNLSTEEMKQAMKVTSMITSEYLRAGRNANEASLAVKDVLQGQFQRLSRETGVKGEQLKEAGWSGDTTDVMGLMKALEKVAEDRNWDVFAEKANSLNDIVTILQNRFGEWSADMVYAVQPTILSVFNSLMSVGALFGDVFNGIGAWLTGDAIGKGVGWTLLAGSIASVVTGLIHLRTGANLTQIAQMGLTKSIGATVLGLDAEIVAEHGLRTALLSSVTGIEANTVANKGRLNSIIASISGLKAEEVAEIGKTKTLLSSILGLDMATLKEYGFATALGVATTQIEAETFASKGLLTQIALIGATTLPAIAVVGAFAVALGSLAMKSMEATNRMKEFYDIQKNGEQYVKDARDSVQMLKDKQEELTKTQSKYTKGSQEYENVGKAIDSLNDKLRIANQNVNDNYEALQRVNSAQSKYDSTKLEAQLELQRKINQSLVDTGLSTKEANELSNDYLRNAIDGAEQLYKALQTVVDQYEKSAEGVEALTNYWSDKGLTGEEIKVKVEPYIDAQSDLAGHIEKMKLSTDVMELATTWAMVQYDQIKLSFSENMPKIEAGDWEGGLTGLLKGLAHGLADLPIFSDFWNEVFKLSGVTKYSGKGWDGLKQFFEDSINNFFSMINPFEQLPKHLEEASKGWDPVRDIYKWLEDSLTGLGDIDVWKMITDALFGETVSASDGSSDHPSIMEDISNILGFDVQTWIDNFNSDPLGTLGISGLIADVGGFLSSLFPSEEGNGLILDWVNTNLVQPMGQSLYNGIMSIPLVSDILQLFGLVNGDNSGASQKGQDIGDAFKQKVEDVIRNIPIVGDIAQILGLIPQQNSNARDKGHGIGQNIKDGEKSGQNGLADQVRTEIGNIIDVLTKKVGEVYQKAWDIGNNIVKGVKDAMGMHSPSIISRELLPKEFGVYIPQAISDNASTVYDSAYQYGMAIRDGISSVNTDFSMGGVADEYQQDAQIISTYSQMMGMDTTTAFNDMSLAVNDTTNTMATNVATSYSTMQQKQQSLLNNMKSSNTTAYNEMYQKSNQSLLQMRDSTSNITNQMINAWSHMKTQLVATANDLRSESTNHFNQLSNTIGSFYRKIQNPSSWGSAGSPTMSSAPKRRVGRAVASSLGASGGRNSWKGGSTMSIGSLKRQICPNGDCGDLFDGYTATDIVDVATFLSMADGSFGWNGWNRTHYNHIKNKSDQWDMKSPIINLVGGIQTNSKFKVGEFNNGQPRISFNSFQGMAESIFSAIPYRFYYDSSWKGSWLGALQSGACNCYDGASALIAFANSCGFSGYMQHGTWTDADGSTYGHVWAVIDGKKMDTTGWQQRGTWTPSSSAGSPMRTTSVKSGDEIHIHIDMSNSTNYGVDNIEEIVEEGVKKGLREQFSNPVTVRI